MYDPPIHKNINLGYHQAYISFEHTAYDEGWTAAFIGLKETDNPYKESGHERDTTYEDEANYQWYKGFNDYSWEA